MMSAPKLRKPISSLLMPLLLAYSAYGNAFEIADLNIHGFISQGYLKSQGNNFYGESLDGSTDFSEAALSSNWRIDNKFSIAGQIVSRDAGQIDNGGVDVDYLFLDFKAIENSDSGLGLRLGRVRNTFGLYNDTRDTIFTRPTILMPQTVYFEGNGLREILFASNGAQLYSYWDADGDSTSFTLTAGRDRRFDEDVTRNLAGGAPIGRVSITSPIFARLQHSMDGGSTIVSLSGLSASIDSTDSPLGPQGNAKLDATAIVLSLQKNLEHWSFSTEFSSMAISYHIGAIEISNSESQSAYLQAQYRSSKNIVTTMRYEYGIGDTEHPNETDSSQLVLGIRWTPTPAWVIAADLYGIRGLAGISNIENENRAIEERSEIFAFMIGYRF
ncbi:MAG: hypothetical protein ACSHWQ_07770 [Spongiibacteraceae bacterium]